MFAQWKLLFHFLFAVDFFGVGRAIDICRVTTRQLFAHSLGTIGPTFDVACLLAIMNSCITFPFTGSPANGFGVILHHRVANIAASVTTVESVVAN
jgi:hypothetical protein